METINTVELRDESIYPDEQVLKSIIGETYNSCCELLNIYTDNSLEHEWRYYNDGKAWLCKVQKKKRTIVWMSVWKGYMQATIYFPEKYIDKVYSMDINEEIKKRIKGTKNTGKSKPCIFEIRTKDILKDFEKVMKLKRAAK